MPRKKLENVVKVEATFKMKVIVRNGMDINQLLKKETEYIAEPQSVNGCVINMKLKDIKKII